MQPKAIAIGTIAVLVLIILIQNLREVSVNLLFWSIDMPKLVLILITAFLGFVLGYLVCSLQKKR